MPRDPIQGYTMGDFTPVERKYKDVPKRVCKTCPTVLSRYTAGEHCSLCAQPAAPTTFSLAGKRRGRLAK